MDDGPQLVLVPVVDALLGQKAIGHAPIPWYHSFNRASPTVSGTSGAYPRISRAGPVRAHPRDVARARRIVDDLDARVPYDLDHGPGDLVDDVSPPDPMFITRPIAPSHSPAVRMARAVSTT